MQLNLRIKDNFEDILNKVDSVGVSLILLRICPLFGGFCPRFGGQAEFD